MKWLLIFIVLGAIFLFTNSGITGHTISEPLKIGYCPTMKGVALELASKNNWLLVEQESSAEAISSFNNGVIDVALIGRLAKSSEINNAKEQVLGSGYTLVTKTKSSIQKSDLGKIVIHTALSEEIARELLPLANFVFYDSTSEAVSKGLSGAVLIDWTDYNDDYELLVVINGDEKDITFRLPVLYSKHL